MVVKKSPKNYLFAATMKTLRVGELASKIYILPKNTKMKYIDINVILTAFQ